MVVSLLLVLAYAFLGFQLLTLLSNLLAFPVLESAPTFTSPERVSLLVPARNEALTLPHTLPKLLGQIEAHEIIVLDDASSDATPQLLQAFKEKNRKLKVLAGEPLPKGWGGKNWACHQLAEAASGDLLIFTDADVSWSPGALASVLELRRQTDAQYLSVWPRQVTKTFWERVTVPVIDLVLLGALPYLGVKYIGAAALSAGNGQLMLWTREAYMRVGGHAAFKNEVLEDVRMGQAAKGAGLRVALALGGKMVSARMYRSQTDILEGFSKNILAAVGNSRVALAALSLANGLVYSLSWVLGFVDPWWFGVGALGFIQRALTSWKTGRHPGDAFLQPFVVYPLWRIAYRAWRRGGSYTWKGRSYGGGSG